MPKVPPAALVRLDVTTVELSAVPVSEPAAAVDDGGCHVADVVPVAVSTCPVVGAVALEMDTVVVAVLSPFAAVAVSALPMRELTSVGAVSVPLKVAGPPRKR